MRLHLLLLTSLLCVACNGRDSKSINTFQDYPGNWQLVVNLTLDECGVLPEDVFSFTDDVTIQEQQDRLLVDAESGFFASTPGELRQDGSLIIEDSQEGDLFGDGIFCSYSNSLSYLNLEHGSSDALFVQRLSCADGYICESHGVGKATQVK